MRAQLIAIAVLGSFISNVSGAEFNAGPPPDNWAKVQELSRGVTVALKMKGGDSIRGEFVQLADDAILVVSEGSERVYPKNSVAELRLVRAGSRTRNAAIAGGVLFGVMFGIGYAMAPKVADDDTLTGGERAAAGAACGAIAGGIAAGITALKHPKTTERLIYTAR